MKKLLFTVLFTILSLSVFADEKMQKAIEDFLNKGNFIAIVKKNDAFYYPKSIIAHLTCDNEKFTFTYIDKEFDYETESFDYNKVIIAIDENSNITIKK